MAGKGELPGPMRLPPTVLGAVVLGAVNALIGLFFPPVGLVWAIVFGAGALGAAQAEQWGYWVLVVSSALSWLLSLANGRVDVISTTVVLFVLLMTPSARATFGLRQT